MNELPANIYSFKIKKETLGKGVQYVQCCWLRTYFTSFSSVSSVEFVQVNICWPDYYYSI